MLLLLFISVDASAETTDAKCSRPSSATPHMGSAINNMSVDAAAEIRVEMRQTMCTGVFFSARCGRKAHAQT